MEKLTSEQVKEFKGKIGNAFRELRKRGYFARKNFWCCQSCAWAAVPEGAEKVVFYHGQDNDDIPSGKIHLAWDGSGAEIKMVLENAGLYVEWNGKEDTRIVVKYQ